LPLAADAGQDLGVLDLDGLQSVRAQAQEREDGRAIWVVSTGVLMLAPADWPGSTTRMGRLRSCGSSPPCSAILLVPPV
jgi:hypothetical protein